MTNKTCTICKIDQSAINYNVRYAFCKSCQKIRNREYNIKHAAELKIKKAEYFQENKKHLKEKNKEWIAKNKQRVWDYRKRTYHENLDKSRSYGRELQKRLRRERPLNCLKQRLRSRLCSALTVKSWKKNTKFAEYIGCSQEELLKHIENQFVAGMTWETRHLWDIDHKIPLSTANTEEELYKLCHFSNLQPMWKKDNRIKSNKV